LFIDKISKIGFIETNSEIEALILEASLIKKYQPKFNVVWRDDKNYFYVAIEKIERPFIYITHQQNNNAEYIGPFVEGTALKKALKFLRRAFPFYTQKTHPKTKCTWCHLDLCPGVNTNLKYYKKNLKKLILILQGKSQTVLKSLKKDMDFLAKKRKFEEAGKIRDKIFALQRIMEHANVIEQKELKKNNTWDSIQKILQGIANQPKEIRRIECYDISNTQGSQSTGSMVVFEEGAPTKNQYKKFKIKIDGKPNDIAMLKEVISRRLQHSEWEYPQIMLIDGGKAQLNAALSVINSVTRASISVIPSLTGNPKTRQGANTLDSRFRENDIQSIKVISIAKGRQELWIENRKEPIPLKNLPQEIYNLVKNLDDEAHRFAITYHKKLRKNNLLKN